MRAAMCWWLQGLADGWRDTALGRCHEDGVEIPAYEAGHALGLRLGGPL